MSLVDKLMEILKEKHGRDLDIQDNVYYLFLDGGLFTLYLDEEEKTLKVDIDLLPEETFVYFSNKNLDKILENSV